MIDGRKRSQGIRDVLFVPNVGGAACDAQASVRILFFEESDGFVEVDLRGTDDVDMCSER